MDGVKIESWIFKAKLIDVCHAQKASGPGEAEELAVGLQRLLEEGSDGMGRTYQVRHRVSYCMQHVQLLQYEL